MAQDLNSICIDFVHTSFVYSTVLLPVTRGSIHSHTGPRFRNNENHYQGVSFLFLTALSMFSRGVSKYQGNLSGS